MTNDTTWIAGLLVIALFVSAIGTFTAVTKFSATGNVAGTTSASVAASTTITLPVSTVNFGSVQVGSTDDTTDNAPAPFQVQNDGSVNVNVTISATDLWTAADKATTDYQFNCGAGELACPSGSASSWTDLNATAQTLVVNLPIATGGDMVEADIKIHVPAAEASGAKSSTVTVTATQA